MKYFVAFLLLVTTGSRAFSQGAINPSAYDHPVRVACIGASITYGAGIADVPRDAYPAQLGRMLGRHWDVRNFGVNSTTMLKKGDFPYWKTEAFQKAQEFQPDVVFIDLGGNDTKPQNWKYKPAFNSDYTEMIRIFENLPSHPHIYISSPLPVYHDRWGITAKVVKGQLLPMLKELAKKQKVAFLDMYSPLEGHPEIFRNDGIHPDKEGAGIMAQTAAHALTGKMYTPLDANYPGKKSSWLGFDRYDFQYDYLSARLVVPHKAAPGNPWVWRARFPDWHTGMDSILLENGYYIVYLNTDNMIGSPRAIGYWNDLYNYLTSHYHFSKKVALEGVSRGALYIYRFAKAYPERTACIYAEAPVCDIKSWPGGKEKSPGDPAEWKALLKEYHLTEEQAMHYADNPIDSLEKIARYKIPVWHSIGLHDSLAPPDENTFILAKRYLELGGPITIYPNTLGETSLQGHHFPIDDPGAGAAFIMYNCSKKEDHAD